MTVLDAIYRVIHQPSGHVVDDFDREDSAIGCAEDENAEYPGEHVVVKYVRADLAQQPAAAVPAGFVDWLAREMPAGTVIGDPQWWAKLIARRFAQFANKENTND